jgi:hypothetical protein
MPIVPEYGAGGTAKMAPTDTIDYTISMPSLPANVEADMRAWAARQTGVSVTRLDLKGKVELIISFTDPKAAAGFAAMMQGRGFPVNSAGPKPKSN